MTPRTLARSGCFILVGLALLGGLVRVARSDELDRMTRVLSAPSGAKITHTIRSRSGLPFRTALPTTRTDVVTAGEGRVGKAWVDRLLRILRLPAALQAVRDTCPLLDPADEDVRVDSARVLVAIGSEGGGVWCEFRFGTGRLFVRDTSTVSVELALGDRAPAVLALLQEAMPNDGRLAEIPTALATGRFAADTLAAVCRGIPLDSVPEIRHRVPPGYPDAARDAGIQGQVQIMARLDRSGRVTETTVVHSVPGLDEAAVRAVEQWQFRPALLRGRPAAVWVTIPVNFRLH